MAATRQERAVRQLWKSQVRAGGVDAIYTRGNEVCELKLVPGTTDTGGSTVEDIAFLNTDTEWIAERESLRLDDEETLPVKGDKILVDWGEGRFSSYAVLKPTAEEDCWRPSDQFGVLIRIHAKHRETFRK